MISSTRSRCASSSRTVPGRQNIPAEDPGLPVQVAPDHQVLEHGHALEQREVLERAADAEPRDLVRRASA